MQVVHAGGQLWQLPEARYIPLLHESQLATLEQVAQGAVQAVQLKLSKKYPLSQARHQVSLLQLEHPVEQFLQETVE